jgi:hypothetical protein
MKVYIASSWKNQHAVEMLTDRLRNKGCEVLSFVENNHGEHTGKSAADGTPVPFDQWVQSELGHKSFVYDTDGATKSDLVIYIGPSGTDAWAEVGAAWGVGVPIIGLWAKGEQSGLMRRMVQWTEDYRELLSWVDQFYAAKKSA